MTCHSFSYYSFFLFFHFLHLYIYVVALEIGSCWFLCIRWALSFLLIPNTCDSVATQLSPGKLPILQVDTIKCHFKGALCGTSADDSHLHIEDMKLSSLKRKID